MRGQLFLRPSCSWACACWKRWTRPVLLSSAAVLLLTVPGCSFLSSTPDPLPGLPVLTSLQRMDRNGTPGVWMNSEDAGRLAQWMYDVTGEAGQ